MVLLILFDTLVHPIVNASTLMQGRPPLSLIPSTHDRVTWTHASAYRQIGYEPVPPYESTSLFGRPALALPNVLDYCWIMRDRDGIWLGWYRGLGATLLANLAARAAAELVFFATGCDDDELTPELYSQMTEDQRQAVFVRSAGRTALAQAVAVVCSQPLHVVAVRTMAQFVGMETKYSGVLGGLMQAIDDDGVSGVFAGLLPRLIGDVSTILCAAAFTHAISVYVFSTADLGFVWSLAYWASGKVFHPFHVVATTLAVNDCGLAAGTHPRMPIYGGWRHCWSSLAAQGTLMRGDRYFWRYAPPPVASTAHATKGEK